MLREPVSTEQTRFLLFLVPPRVVTLPGNTRAETAETIRPGPDMGAARP